MKTMIVDRKYPHSELTAKVIGAAMEVHKILGNGFPTVVPQCGTMAGRQEVIYQRALAIELEEVDLSFVREQEMQIEYKDQDIGTRRVDFFVEDSVMVEIKALTKLEDVHLAQAINYLEAYGLEIGLLINFGTKSLEFKRVMNLKSAKSQSIN